MENFKIDSVPGTHDGVRILRLSGAFTLKDLFEFQSVTRGQTDPVLIIDLTDVPYMDSASVGSIMSVHTSAETHHRKYALVGVTERIRTLFNVVGLDGILVMYPTVEEAVEKLGIKTASN